MKSGVRLISAFSAIVLMFLRKRKFMKRKLSLFLVLILAFSWSAVVADTTPATSASDAVSVTKIDKVEQEKLLVTPDQKEEIFQEEEKVYIDEKAQAQLEAEKLEAEAEAQKLAEQDQIDSAKQLEQLKARLDELWDREQDLTESELEEFKMLYDEFYPQELAKAPSGGTILVTGDDCTDPLVVELDVVGLPYNDISQTNCGRIDDYDLTCLGSYDSGEDIIYEIIVGTAGDYIITMNPYTTTWSGILIDDTCPAGSGSGDCIAKATGSGATPRIMNVYLDAGTYYIQVDTYSTPDCIPVFDLTIDAYVPPQGRCCYNYFADCAEMSQSACLTQTGYPEWAEGLNCIDDPCPTLAQGDYCADPIVIPESFPYTNTDNTCNFHNFCDIPFTDNKDVIYEMTLTSDAYLTLSLCGATWDTKMAVFQNECCTGPGTEYVWDDDGCDPGLQSLINYFFPAGVYYVVVDAYGTTSCGDYTLSVDVWTPPMGRCCYDDPVQCLEMPQIECDLLTGFWVEGLTCADPCPGTEGNDCNNPLVIDLNVETLPYVDANQTTCGKINDYSETCLGSYDGGEDIIYELIVGTAGDYIITMDPLGATWTGILIDDTCPPGNTGECIAYQTGSSGIRTLNVNLPAGTYYIMVDTWPSPNCIPMFDLTIAVPPTGRCCYNYYVDCTDGITQSACLALPGEPLWDEGLNCTDDPCAAPVGRCCYNDYADCGDLNEADCIALSGLWDEGVTCAEYSCASVPTNDECAVATPLDIPSAVYGSTILANADVAPTCGTGNGTGGGVWYSVIGTGNTITATLCSEFTTYDTKIRVFCNSCDDLMCAAGDDDDPTCTYGTLQSTAIWCSEAGTEYFILVHGFSTQVGYFMLDLSDDGVPCGTAPTCVPPTGRCCYNYYADCAEDITQNECLALPGYPQWTIDLTCADPCPEVLEGDYCANAFVIPESFPYNTSGNTCAYNNFCDIPLTDNREVIYELEITSVSYLTVSLCNSTYDTKLAIFMDECCTGDGTQWAYNDDFCGLQSEISAAFTPGLYYIVVDGYGTSSCGDYVLDIFTYEPPTGACCVELDCVGTNTELDCDALGGTWHMGQDCVDFVCPIPPVETCTDQSIYDNGDHDLVNGTRPTANWDPQGMIDDFSLDAPADISCFRVEFIDISTPPDTPSGITDVRIRIYDAPDGLYALDWAVDGDFPVFDYTYTGADLNEIDSGFDNFGGDVIYFDLCTEVGVTLPAGNYGMFLTFPGVGPIGLYFASAPANGTEFCAVWGSTLPIPSPGSFENIAFHLGVGDCGGGGDFPCGHYVVGDFNGSDVFNLADVISAFSKLQTGSPDAANLCECPPGGGNTWAIAMDVNGNCAFNLADVISAFSKLQTGSPDLVGCPTCPPDPNPAPRGGNNPLVVPNLESKAKISNQSGME